jgi:hypothetical protein
MQKDVGRVFTQAQLYFVGTVRDSCVVELRGGPHFCELGVLMPGETPVVARIGPSAAAALAGALMDFVRASRGQLPFNDKITD